MAKSNTPDTLTVEALVNQTVDYMRKWSQAEIETMINNAARTQQMPIIARIGKNGFIVGNYAVQFENDRWWKLSNRFSDTVYVFTSKLSAVLYAIYRQTGKINQADKILAEDEEVSRLTTKTEQYYFRYKQAQKKKNLHNVDLFFVRYQETSRKLNASRSLLEKTLKSAKYIKS